MSVLNNILRKKKFRLRQIIFEFFEMEIGKYYEKENVQAKVNNTYFEFFNMKIAKLKLFMFLSTTL